MYFGANIAPIGITTCIPKSPPGCSWGTWDGRGVGLKEVELVDRILVDSTTNYDEKHQKQSSSDKDERDDREGCS